MTTKVMKFGGGCLYDSESIQKAVRIIKNEIGAPVIVVSALFGVTRKLKEGINSCLESQANIPLVIKDIRGIHGDILNQCIDCSETVRNTLDEINTKLNQLKRLFKGIYYTQEVTPSLKASILSFGENLSAQLVSSVLNYHGIHSMALESDQIGIITDSHYMRASPKLKKIKANLEERLVPIIERGVVPVITGFWGISEEGKVTTFGGNGTDYSAAIIASGLGADTLDIWKNVDGFMTADPDIVIGCSRIKKLSYREAAEFSYFGSKILHPRTIEPLVEENIRMNIRNINNPMNETIVCFNDSTAATGTIKGVTYNLNVAMIRMHGSGVGYKPGIMGKLGNSLSMNDINIFTVITAQTCINLLIDDKDSVRVYNILKSMENGVFENIEIIDNVALVAVVGEGLHKTSGLAAKTFTAVAEQGINVEIISSGASEVTLYFIVNRKDLECAVNAVHDSVIRKEERKNVS